MEKETNDFYYEIINKDKNKNVQIIKKEDKTKRVLYGLIDNQNNLLIKPSYSLKQLQDIDNFKEVIKGIYLFFNYKKNNKILFLYDKPYNKLINVNCDNYEILANIIILKKIKNDKINLISFYDPYRLKYFDYSNFKEEEQLFSQGGIVLFPISSIFYDTITGILHKLPNYKLEITKNKFLKLIDLNTLEIIAIYDFKTRDFKKYNITSIPNLYYRVSNEQIEYLYDYQSNNLKIPIVKQFKEFNAIIIPAEKTIIFSKESTLIKEYDEELKITEIKRNTMYKLGIKNSGNKPVYLINGKLYFFNNRKYPFSNNATYPFRIVLNTLIATCYFKYGIGIIETNSKVELDYLLEQVDLNYEQIDNNLRKTFEENQDIQDCYPKLVLKHKKENT